MGVDCWSDQPSALFRNNKYVWTVGGLISHQLSILSETESCHLKMWHICCVGECNAIAGWPVHLENLEIPGTFLYIWNYLENPYFSIFTWKYLELFSIFVQSFIIPNLKLLNFDYYI